METQDTFMIIASNLFWYNIHNLCLSSSVLRKFITENKNEIYKSCIHIEPHSVDDLPARIFSNGTQLWYREGKLHRDGRPAFISKDGTQKWFTNGKLHRDNNLPAIIFSNGVRLWYQNGKRHREGDLPAAVYTNGTNCWYLNDCLQLVRFIES